jgi:hypothetical protein
MARVDREVAGEPSAQGLVGGDQCLQPLVDLPVLALAPPRHGLHDWPADPNRDEREDDKADERRHDALPGAEIE